MRRWSHTQGLLPGAPGALQKSIRILALLAKSMSLYPSPSLCLSAHPSMSLSHTRVAQNTQQSGGELQESTHPWLGSARPGGSPSSPPTHGPGSPCSSATFLPCLQAPTAGCSCICLNSRTCFLLSGIPCLPPQPQHAFVGAFLGHAQFRSVPFCSWLPRAPAPWGHRPPLKRREVCSWSDSHSQMVAGSLSFCWRPPPCPSSRCT